MFQDMSKAYDRVNPFMLNLAMARLKFPHPLRVFILNLFCNRKNQVTTQHGLIDPYDVLIGIDQGKLFRPYCGAYIMTRYSVKHTRDHTSVTLFSIHSSPILIILLLTTHF